MILLDSVDPLLSVITSPRTLGGGLSGASLQNEGFGGVRVSLNGGLLQYRGAMVNIP